MDENAIKTLLREFADAVAKDPAFPASAGAVPKGFQGLAECSIRAGGPLLLSGTSVRITGMPLTNPCDETMITCHERRTTSPW